LTGQEKRSLSLQVAERLNGGEDAAWIDFVVFPPFQTDISVPEQSNVSHYITCFPNPANDMITISLGVYKSDIISMDIVDLNGKLVLSVENNLIIEQGEYTKTINVAHLSAGNYYLRLLSDKVSLNHPFVIVR